MDPLDYRLRRANVVTPRLVKPRPIMLAIKLASPVFGNSLAFGLVTC